MTLEKALQIITGNQEDDEAEKFLKFLSEKLWGLYNTYVMDKIKMLDGDLKWDFTIPNAKENIVYNQTVPMPQVVSRQSDDVELVDVEAILLNVTGLDEEKHGLKLEEIGRASVGKECVRRCRSRWSPYH